ncbi:MAG: sugar phosphate isomerase/epimerase family protein [Candidatus Sulfotelmatobacter sp.]
MRTKEYAPEAALFPTSTDRHEPIKVKPRLPRRDFLSLLGATAAAALTSSFSASALAAAQTSAPESHTPRLKSPFRVSVINDEISQDFGRACEVASREFGMEWIELRGMWKKNIINLDASEIAETQRILKKYQLRVTDIASPLFKVDWPGAPRSKYSTSDDFHADFKFAQQDEVLDRASELAKTFRTDRVRCFDFWRLDDPAPHRAAINAKLLEAAGKAAKQGVILLLENDVGLNTATGAEAAMVLKAVNSPSLMLNWDPGNAAAAGEIPYPDGYHLLPKDRIGHCHCKDVVRRGKDDWAAMGKGVVDWAGQFAAFKRDGYHYAVSLETHWDGGGTPEKSTRQSWAGMKELLQRAGTL